jgi:hypothetical protein
MVTYQSMQFVDNQIAAMTHAARDIVKTKALDKVHAKWQLEALKGRDLTNQEKISVYMQAKDIVEAKEWNKNNGTAKRIPSRGEEGFIDEVGITPEKYIAEFESHVPKKNVDALWKAVNAATDYSLDLQIKTRFIDKATYNKYSQRRFYVPQRGWNERELLEENPSRYNEALVKAEGRDSLAADPMAYIQSIGLSTIAQVYKNMNKQKTMPFLLLVYHVMC